MDTIHIRQPREVQYKATRKLHYFETDLSNGIYRWLLQNKDNHLVGTEKELRKVLLDYCPPIAEHYTLRVFQRYNQTHTLLHPEDVLSMYQDIIAEYIEYEIVPEQLRYLVKYTSHTDYHYSQARADGITMFIANQIREASIMGLPALILAAYNEFKDTDIAELEQQLQAEGLI